MLKRRKPAKSGIRRAGERRSPGHLSWVRGFECVCSASGGCGGRIEAAHLRSGVPAHEAGGTGMKPHDKWAFPCCHDHHAFAHAIGEITFQTKYGLSLRAICEDLARRSPHRGDWTDDG